MSKTTKILTLGIIPLLLGGIIFASNLKAQEVLPTEEKSSSTPAIVIEKTDTEKLLDKTKELEVVDNLVSKYAQLYDSCRFK